MYFRYRDNMGELNDLLEALRDAEAYELELVEDDPYWSASELLNEGFRILKKAITSWKER